MTDGFANPVTAGNILVQPAIQSPNFSIAGQTGWAIEIGGQAYFFSLTAVGPITTASGITVGVAGGSEIVLNPNANTAFDVTTAISGFLQAVEQFITTDGSEVVAGALGSLLLGTGTATKMATALTSAFGSSGAAILLESENDGGTDTPVITFGTVTTPDAGTTLVYSPIATITPYAFLLYSGASGQTVVTKTSGSGTIPIPAGVSTVKAESWGSSSGGSSSAPGGGGGGSGEYAAEPALAVTTAGVAYAVGAAGAIGGAGNPSTLTGTSVTVTGHGGGAPSGATGGLGGSGYGGTTSHPGGAGGAGIGGAGGGGGGSGGPSAPATRARRGRSAGSAAPPWQAAAAAATAASSAPTAWPARHRAAAAAGRPVAAR